MPQQFVGKKMMVVPRSRLIFTFFLTTTPHLASWTEFKKKYCIFSTSTSSLSSPYFLFFLRGCHPFSLLFFHSFVLRFCFLLIVLKLFFYIFSHIGQRGEMAALEGRWWWWRTDVPTAETTLVYFENLCSLKKYSHILAQNSTMKHNGRTDTNART